MLLCQSPGLSFPRFREALSEEVLITLYKAEGLFRAGVMVVSDSLDRLVEGVVTFSLM